MRPVYFEVLLEISASVDETRNSINVVSPCSAQVSNGVPLGYKSGPSNCLGNRNFGGAGIHMRAY
jgi:hypothetical protein